MNAKELITSREDSYLIHKTKHDVPKFRTSLPQYLFGELDQNLRISRDNFDHFWINYFA